MPFEIPDAAQPIPVPRSNRPLGGPRPGPEIMALVQTPGQLDQDVSELTELEAAVAQLDATEHEAAIAALAADSDVAACRDAGPRALAALKQYDADAAAIEKAKRDGLTGRVGADQALAAAAAVRDAEIQRIADTLSTRGDAAITRYGLRTRPVPTVAFSAETTSLYAAYPTKLFRTPLLESFAVLRATMGARIEPDLVHGWHLLETHYVNVMDRRAQAPERFIPPEYVAVFDRTAAMLHTYLDVLARTRRHDLALEAVTLLRRRFTWLLKTARDSRTTDVNVLSAGAPEFSWPQLQRGAAPAPPAGGASMGYMSTQS